LKIETRWVREGAPDKILDVDISSNDSDLAEELYHVIQDFMGTREKWVEV